MTERRAPRRKPPPPPDISRGLKPKGGKIIPFRQNVPKKLSRRNENLIIYYDQLRNLISFEMIVTFVLIAFAAIFATAIHAYNTNIQTGISRANQELRTYRTTVFNLTDQLSERYTSYEIERIASERLGMAFPDPSQIIHIEVHRQGTIMMNVTDDLLPPENRFWQDVTGFVRNMINRIFGGS
ncbi:MAG: hypothetical protein FWB91_03525 [Defluviitaleaceae bacterium]|nr:hypothetical protein [Defluviitaleaceae bacterium]